MRKTLMALAGAAALVGGVASSVDAAGPHQMNRPFMTNLNTYYGVTSNGISSISADGKSASVESYLLDRTDGHCGSLEARAILNGAARGPAVTVVVNCSTQYWAWGKRSLLVAATSPNAITGLEARICQTNSAGTQTGVCTQYVPINI